mmetsp:Transcript_109983/g.275494  ORF Transcript_109983/g.275494 Transcript_109983/m.275494 type:complete len:204 (-) Transcript_109983:1047-1658(-)
MQARPTACGTWHAWSDSLSSDLTIRLAFSLPATQRPSWNHPSAAQVAKSATSSVCCPLHRSMQGASLQRTHPKPDARLNQHQLSSPADASKTLIGAAPFNAIQLKTNATQPPMAKGVMEYTAKFLHFDSVQQLSHAMTAVTTPVRKPPTLTQAAWLPEASSSAKPRIATSSTTNHKRNTTIETRKNLLLQFTRRSPTWTPRKA